MLKNNQIQAIKFILSSLKLRLFCKPREKPNSIQSKQAFILQDYLLFIFKALFTLDKFQPDSKAICPLNNQLVMTWFKACHNQLFVQTFSRCVVLKQLFYSSW